MAGDKPAGERRLPGGLGRPASTAASAATQGTCALEFCDRQEGGCACKAALTWWRSMGIERGDQGDSNSQLRSHPGRKSTGSDFDSPVIETIDIDVADMHEKNCGRQQCRPRSIQEHAPRRWCDGGTTPSEGTLHGNSDGLSRHRAAAPAARCSGKRQR